MSPTPSIVTLMGGEQALGRNVRIARVASHAVDVFGSSERAAAWLRRGNRGLGGVVPLSLLDTDIGAERVDDVLTRIEHAVIG
ncbi:MAG TPA: MbcA/ParS/Xre antitoxin family protein [Myxococcota bacterium]|nr:MbcA/ParS/Xre antitoxin family protein [Myxococcota bacterium]